ncbi:AraC family transcriptional regulator [Leptospira langatensis]|uniref:AraC family transcriptional regulator n=1 Tax=Leptospira langatensis TaxID=2484983 RepID=A0A5F1ZV23_9LEPT|nr:AraC family transcriptional regulator [Leptospira langatensis]TGK01434.1 AraC family transcriptional regulator [Leptospira langatensis]TGL42116.1 AraC family transcriptional regulator [Leptospira langatensis]
MSDLFGWFLDGLILFGGFLSLLLFVGEFPSDRRNLFQVFLALTLASIGCMQLSSSLVLNQNSGQDQALKFWTLPLLYLPPAFAFLTVLSLSEDDFRFRSRHLIFFLPSLLALGASIYFRSSGEYVRPPWNFGIGSGPAFSGLGLLYLGAGFFSLSFSFPILKALLVIKEARAKFLFTIFCLDSLLVSVLGILGLLYHPIFLKLSLVVVSLAVSLVYYIRRKYFDLPEVLRSDLIQAKYARSRLQGMNTEPILENLDRLFYAEKLHRREDLTLAELAKELSITSHQLSELLNNRLGKGYFSFINQHRIEDAKELLKGTDKTVLEIAMTVGFNNRSSFNEAFLRITQKTPISFRKMYKPL